MNVFYFSQCFSPAHQLLLNQLNGTVRFACDLLFIFFIFSICQVRRLLTIWTSRKDQRFIFIIFRNQISQINTRFRGQVGGVSVGHGSVIRWRTCCHDDQLRMTGGQLYFFPNNYVKCSRPDKRPDTFIIFIVFVPTDKLLTCTCTCTSPWCVISSLWWFCYFLMCPPRAPATTFPESSAAQVHCGYVSVLKCAPPD